VNSRAWPQRRTSSDDFVIKNVISGFSLVMLTCAIAPPTSAAEGTQAPREVNCADSEKEVTRGRSEIADDGREQLAEAKKDPEKYSTTASAIAQSEANVKQSETNIRDAEAQLKVVEAEIARACKKK
jgi:septal ring factor EnvC (AmiA/AmiB activator)